MAVLDEWASSTSGETPLPPSCHTGLETAPCQKATVSCRSTSLGLQTEGGNDMAADVTELLARPWREQNRHWLQQMLRIAIQLEWATIPPYLCAWWSINESPPGYIKNRLSRIWLGEMRHLGLACNLLCAFHRDGDYPHFDPLPVLNDPVTAPSYPGPLPGGVHPGLSIGLSKLTKEQVGTQFMQLEFPHPEAVQSVDAERDYSTIGEFYRRIRLFIEHSSLSISHEFQRDYPNLFSIIEDVDDALDAIDKIAAEGEGAHGSPFLPDPDDPDAEDPPLSHYYQFAEFFWQRRIVPCDSGGWGFCGDEIPWPDDIFDMAPVPRRGYWTPSAIAFDRQYTRMLDLLTGAWHRTDAGGQQMLYEAIEAMKSLTAPAQALMQIPRPNGNGNYGPCFRIIH